MVSNSLFLLLSDQGGVVVKGVGMISLFFFFPLGLYGLLVVVPSWFRRPILLVLTTNGLERQTRSGVAFIPWNDVTEIGVLKMPGNNMVGLRLYSYDRYLNNLSPLVAQEFNRISGLNKMVHRLLGKESSWDAQEAGRLWSRLARTNDPAGTLRELGDLGDVAETLLSSRQVWGHDLLFAWYDLDRPTTKMAGLMEAYRQNSYR